MACAALVAWSLVFFPLVDTKVLPLIIIALFIEFALHGMYLGPQPAVFSELFKSSVRYSGASLSVQLGTIFGGGLVPFIATALYASTNSSWSLTAYKVVLALIALLCVLGLKESYRRDLDDEVKEVAPPHQHPGHPEETSLGQSPT